VAHVRGDPVNPRRLTGAWTTEAPGPHIGELSPSSALPGPADLARWLGQALDHADRGMLLVAADGRVLHANQPARRTLRPAGAALRLADGCLLARNAREQQTLQQALSDAAQHGLRRLLHLEQGDSTQTVAVMPLDGGGAGVALVSLSQVRGAQPDLTLQGFARQHGITTAETAVLQALLVGRTPSDIAREKGVRLTTVRTQISQLRQKCGTRTVRELLHRVAALPPMPAAAMGGD
jgi:DNA-binding CsgD family transcriptional regulator